MADRNDNYVMKIDVSKIPAEALYQGEKGLWLTVYVNSTPDAPYSTHQVVLAADSENGQWERTRLGNMKEAPTKKGNYSKPKKSKNTPPWISQ